VYVHRTLLYVARSLLCADRVFCVSASAMTYLAFVRVSAHTCMDIYICIHICIYIYISIFIYSRNYTKREKGRKQGSFHTRVGLFSHM